MSPRIFTNSRGCVALNMKFKRELPLHVMLIVPALLVLVYCYGPMLGLLMAFEDFTPSTRGIVYSLLHSRFIGLETFRYILDMPDTLTVVWNTFFISMMKIIVKLIVPLIYALLINEVSVKWYKKAVQTITFLPYFLSWVILSGILLDFFSPRDGAVNQLLAAIKLTPVYFFGNAAIFPFMLVATDLWKEVGLNTIIILAAITNIDPTLYEAAIIDGAGRWKQIRHVTIPGIATIVMLLGVLSMGDVLNAGFDQVFNLYSPSVYSSGDIIDTYVYRAGLQNGQFSIATAVGLFKSLVAFVMITLGYRLASRFSNYRIF